MIRGISYVVIFVIVVSGIISLFAFDLIKIDWVSFMEIQPSFRPMEKPQPVPADSIPIEGAAYTIAMGVPANPVMADEVSIQRGEELYRINCAQCHGKSARGDGVVSTYFAFKPADLTSEYVQQLSDAALFNTLSTGVLGRMPPLNENLTVRDRWDIVNFISAIPKVFAPTPAP